MDEVFVVRHKVVVEGKSVRCVAREMGVARNTVRRYLRGAPPGTRKPSARSRLVTDRVRARAEEILGEAPRWTGGKQRLTATRLWRMLVEEGVSAGETVVKEIVREWRRRRQEVFVPLVYKPGDLAEVDFFEVLVDVAGERGKTFLFVMRLMYSGRDFAWLYRRQDPSVLPRRARAGVLALRRRSPAGCLRQSPRGGRTHSRRLGARADVAVSGTHDALRVRSELRAAVHRARQGRSGGAREGHPLAGIGAHSVGTEPRDHQRGVACASGCPRERDL